MDGDSNPLLFKIFVEGTRKMSKIELHVHTSECDLVAAESGANIVRMYKDIGYDGLVITDHYFSLFYEWFKDELAFADHKKIIDRWLKGYYSAKNEAEKIGFTVLSGAEVRFDGTINDYLVYGLDAEDFYSLPLLNRLKNVDELISVLPKKAVVVQAHPFRNEMTVKDPSNLFGIEIHNGCTDEFRNNLAKVYAEYYGKRMTSGSDFHSKNALAKGGIITSSNVRNASDLVSVLRAGNYELII